MDRVSSSDEDDMTRHAIDDSHVCEEQRNIVMQRVEVNQGREAAASEKKIWFEKIPDQVE